MNDIKPQVAVGALIHHPSERKIILVQRANAPGAGLWALPGGRINLGESLVAGVQREVAEETGLLVEVGPPIYAFDRIIRAEDGAIQFHYVIIDFLAQPQNPNAPLQAGDDAAAVAWFGLKDLAELSISYSSLQVARQWLEHGQWPGLSLQPDLFAG